MHEAPDQTQNDISEVTRRTIIDTFSVANISWAGRLQDDEFLARLHDLSKLPSFDHRYENAADDIYQHTVRNSDWDSEWVFYDRRFNLLYASDAEFLRFLCETVHPIVRTDSEAADKLVNIYNEALAVDGFQIVAGRMVSGRPIFAVQWCRPESGWNLLGAFYRVTRKYRFRRRGQSADRVLWRGSASHRPCAC